MSSAQNASIFQSAWLAPFPRLTSIAAAVLTLLTAPVANASVIAAVKNAQGNDVMLFKLLSGAESGTGEDPDDGRIFGASHACFCSTLLKPYLGLSGTGNGLSAGVDICGTVKHVVLSKAGQK